MELELYRDLCYARSKRLDPWYVESIESEMLFCLECGRGDSAETYFGSVLDMGIELFDGEIHEELILPKGSYFFAQERRLVSRFELFQMAKKLEREAGEASSCIPASGQLVSCKLATKCFLRYLFEDAKTVSQLFIAKDSTPLPKGEA